jgi:hypothetical protein
MGRAASWRLLRSAYADAPAAALYWAWVVLVVMAGMASGALDNLHAMKDQMPAGLVLSLCVLLPATRVRMQRVELGLSSVGLLVAALAFAQAFLGGPYPRQLSETAYFKQTWDTSALISNLVVGPFANPNGMALFMTPVGLLAAGRTLDALQSGKLGVASVVHLLCALSAALAVFLGGAKLGLGTLILGTALRVGCQALRIRCTGPRALAGLLALLLCLAVTIVASLGAAASRGLDYKAGTLVDRWLLDVHAVEFLRQEPRVLLVGGGAEAFVQSNPNMLDVHNEFLMQVLRFGGVAAVLFAATVVAAYAGMGNGTWSYAWALSGLVALLLVEPASGAQSQGTVMTILGLCFLRRRLSTAEWRRRRTDGGTVVGNS